MKIYILLVAITVFSILTPVSKVMANIELHPRLTISEEYNDNIFLSEDNEQEDWITTVAPGISVEYDGSSLDLTLDYSLHYQYYQNNSQENQDRFEDIQRATATAHFFIGRPFTLLIRETITRETLSERNNSAEGNNLVNKTTVSRFSVMPQYRFQIGESFSLVFGYTYDRIDYVDPRGNDYEDHTGRLSLVKYLSTNTEISINYNFKSHQANDDEDFSEQRYSLGLNQQLGSRTKISLEGGYSVVDYDNGLSEDTTNWLADISYQLSAPLSLFLSYRQDYSVSATEGLTNTAEASMGIDYVKGSLTSGVEVFWREVDYLRLDRQDHYWGSRIDFFIPLSSSLSTALNAEYENVEFDDADTEKVDRYKCGCSVIYQYRRISTTLAYNYRLNDSDVNNNDYVNNTAILSVSLRF